MAKYVAFIDVLGFKQKLKGLPQGEAEKIIQGFNQEIYSLWQELGYHNDNNHEIKGMTFSDSLVIYTEEISINLARLLKFLVKLYKTSIIKLGLPLRGGIAVGDFNDIPAKEFNNLQKSIVVGNAFIDAYTLESAYGIKGSKILFKQKALLHNQ